MTTSTEPATRTEPPRRRYEPTTRQAATGTGRRVPMDPGGAMLGALSVAMVIVGIVATRRGLLYYPDSAIYLGTAHNLLHGHGLTSPLALSFTDTFSPAQAVRFHGALPITSHAPLYPIVLASVAKLGVSLSTSARVVGVLCLGVGTFLVGWITARLTGGNRVAVAAALLLFAAGGPASAPWEVPASWVMFSAAVLAESLFFVLVLVSLLAVSRLLARGRSADVWAAGIVIGFAMLTRFVGVALVATAVVLIAARQAWSPATRLRRAAAVAALGLGPTLLWRVLLRMFVGSGRAIPLRYHAPGGLGLRDGLGNVGRWFAPGGVAAGLVAVALLAALVAAYLVARSRPRRVRDLVPDRAVDVWLLATIVTFVACYLATVLGTRLFVVANAGFDVRFLAIVRPLVYVVVIAVGFDLLRRFSPTRAAATLALVSFAIVVPQLGANADLVTKGATPPMPPAPPLVRGVAALPAHALVFSNAPETLWGLTHRVSVMVPMKEMRVSQEQNRDFPRDLGQLDALLRRPDSYLVMFTMPSSPVLASLPELEAAIPLRPVATFPDGAIYQRSTR